MLAGLSSGDDDVTGQGQAVAPGRGQRLSVECARESSGHLVRVQNPVRAAGLGGGPASARVMPPSDADLLFWGALFERPGCGGYEGKARKRGSHWGSSPPSAEASASLPEPSPGRLSRATGHGRRHPTCFRACSQRRPDTAARAACDELLCRTEKYIAHLMHMFHPTWLMSSEKTLPLRRHVRIFQEACRCGTLISGHCGGSGRSECGAREPRSFIARYQG